MLDTVSAFLRQHATAKTPFLLALSGGSDSLALFYCLLRCRERGVVENFAVAHVDHKWRTTSSEEALILEKLVRHHEVPWHHQILEPGSLVGNLEERCRQERLLFFHALCRRHGYHAVMLAHHADDQSETVLKRIFEGASLVALAAMTPTAYYGDLLLWRPLLTIPKKILEAYVASYGGPLVDDTTNSDIKYLRARMRSQLIPRLAATFGKEISRPLASIAADAHDLAVYFEELLDPYLATVEEGWAGVKIDLTTMPPLPLLPLRYLLQRLVKKIGTTPLSRHQLEDAAIQLQSGAANKRYRCRDLFLYIDRGRAFVTSSPLETTTKETLPLKVGVQRWGPWSLTVSPLEEVLLPTHSQVGWLAAWRGFLITEIPDGEYVVGPALPRKRHLSTARTLDTLWTERRVPAFFRPLLPVLYHHDDAAVEFLSGHYSPSPLSVGGRMLLEVRIEGEKGHLV